MALQVQCPNCGGYRTSSSSSRVDQITRKRVGGTGRGCLQTVLVIPAVFIITFAVVTAIGDLFVSIVGTSNITLGTIMVVVVIVVTLIVSKIILNKFDDRRKIELSHSIITYRSECSLCGYSWQWDEGKPRHALQVRPDLIQKGAKKLEDEAAAAAAAYYWQQQQNKKKK